MNKMQARRAKKNNKPNKQRRRRAEKRTRQIKENRIDARKSAIREIRILPHKMLQIKKYIKNKLPKSQKYKQKRGKRRKVVFPLKKATKYMQ